MDSTRVVVQARSGSEESCPYCRGVFDPGERVLACEACRTSYHEDCLRTELGRCSTLGCAGKRALPRTTPGAAPIEVSVRPATGGAPPGTVGEWRWSVVVGAVIGAWFTSVHAISRWIEFGFFDAIGAGAAAGTICLLALAFALTWVRRSVASAPAPPPPPPARITPPVAPSGCPVCTASFAPGERLLICEGCAARYHRECLRRVGRCAGPTCSGRRALPGRARAR